jgi:hypothetical protein
MLEVRILEVRINDYKPGAKHQAVGPSVAVVLESLVVQ